MEVFSTGILILSSILITSFLMFLGVERTKQNLNNLTDGKG